MKTYVRKLSLILIAIMVLGSVPSISFAASSGLGKASVKVESAGQTSIKVSWKTVKGAKGYRVYRKKQDEAYKRITTIKTTSYVDKNLTSGQQYTYAVRPYKFVSGKVVLGPYDANGETTYAGVVTPSRLRAGGGMNDYKQISLVWWERTAISGYQIYKARPGRLDPSYKKAADVTYKKSQWDPGSPTTWTDKNVTPGKIYDYKVRFFKVIGGKRVYSDFVKTSAEALYGLPKAKAEIKNQEGQVTDTLELSISNDQYSGKLRIYNDNVGASFYKGDPVTNDHDKIKLNIDQYSTDGIHYSDMTDKSIELNSGETIYLKLKSQEPFTYRAERSCVYMDFQYDNWDYATFESDEAHLDKDRIYSMTVMLENGTINYEIGIA